MTTPVKKEMTHSGKDFSSVIIWGRPCGYAFGRIGEEKKTGKLCTAGPKLLQKGVLEHTFHLFRLWALVSFHFLIETGAWNEGNPSRAVLNITWYTAFSSGITILANLGIFKPPCGRYSYFYPLYIHIDNSLTVLCRCIICLSPLSANR